MKELASEQSLIQHADLGEQLATYIYLDGKLYYYWNKLFNLSDMTALHSYAFMAFVETDYNSVSGAAYLIAITKYSATTMCIRVSPAYNYSVSTKKQKVAIAVDADMNIYIQGAADWTGTNGFKFAQIIGHKINLSLETQGYAALGTDGDFTSVAKIIEAGAVRIVNGDTVSVTSYESKNNYLDHMAAFAEKDGDGNVISTSYLPLSGGTLSGQVFTNSCVSFNTSGRGLIFPGSGQITGFDTGNIFIQNANNGLILRKSDNQLLRRRNGVDSILLTEAEKGVSDGVASLDASAKVPAAQIPVDGKSITANEEGTISLPAGIDYVVEWKAPTDSDPTWYRLYKSGWIEQGGNCAVNSGYGTVTLPKPFSGTDYIINTSINFKTEVQTYKQADSSGADSVTNKSFRIIASNNEDGSITCNVSWRACGYYDNSVSVFNFPLTADYEDADGNADAILGFKSSTIGGTTIDPSYRYKFDALGGSGAALGFHDDSGENKSVYAHLRYDENCYVGTGDFTISADIFIPTPSSTNYNIPINVFTLAGYIPNNIYRLFTFGVVVEKWYSDSITTSIGFRYPTSATAQTDLYHAETSIAGLVPTNLFDQWNRIKLERKNGVTKAYWGDNVFDFGDIAYDLKYFDECNQQRALILPMLEVYNSQATSSNINNMFKIKNVKFIRYGTIGA